MHVKTYRNINDWTFFQGTHFLHNSQYKPIAHPTDGFVLLTLFIECGSCCIYTTRLQKVKVDNQGLICIIMVTYQNPAHQLLLRNVTSYHCSRFVGNDRQYLWETPYQYLQRDLALVLSYIHKWRPSPSISA